MIFISGVLAAFGSVLLSWFFVPMKLLHLDVYAPV